MEVCNPIPQRHCGRFSRPSLHPRTERKREAPPRMLPAMTGLKRRVEREQMETALAPQASKANAMRHETHSRRKALWHR
jgi:hypothetical protein